LIFEWFSQSLLNTLGEDSTAQIEVAVHQSCFVDREGTCGAIADITALRTLFQWAYPKSKLSERGPSKADHFSPQSLYSAIKPHIIGTRSPKSVRFAVRNSRFRNDEFI